MSWYCAIKSCAGFACVLLCVSCATVTSPKPYGNVPSERQLKWHELEEYGFIHFTINTFTDREWGYGDESPSVFNPTEFDADRIVKVMKDSGLKGLILTCKHHDGFCLWPSRYTEHSVKNSPWKNGKGDMVKEFSDACKRHGLKFGVYLSPWDRNHKDYARPEYITYYRNQLRELLTDYGPVFEVWFDGANGGDGYYGGTREMRKIDSKTYYDWTNTYAIVRELQPGACMFSDTGPDVRWCGNERGVAGDPCWSTMDRAGYSAGNYDGDRLNRGDAAGGDWLPAEVDVSIRPGWFYHAHEDDKVKTLDHLLKIYYESVGRGANLLLNIPPDRRGLIHENDAAVLKDWRLVLDKTFKTDLARDAKATAGNHRGNSRKYAPGNVNDGKRETYWATDDGVNTPELVLEMGSPVEFNVVRIKEYLPLGQRIESVALDYWVDNGWKELAKATSIGNQRLIRTENITTSKVRLRVISSRACPAISEVGLFCRPDDSKNK